MPSAELEPGDSEIATVGGVRISAGLVQSLASAASLPPKVALERVVPDAQAAIHLESRQPRQAQLLRRLGLAKVLLRQLLAEAKGAGPPTEEEVDKLAQSRFWETARPRMVQVLHAVVLSAEPSDEAERFAAKLAAAAGPTSDPKAFRAAIESVEAGSWKVKVEALPPVAPDGRTMDPDHPPPKGPAVGHLVEAFAVGAGLLQAVGEVSPVVRSRFGYHVMLLEQSWSAQELSVEKRQDLYAEEIYEARAQRRQAQLLESLRQQLSPVKERAALELMTQLGGRQ